MEITKSGKHILHCWKKLHQSGNLRKMDLDFDRIEKKGNKSFSLLSALSQADIDQAISFQLEEKCIDRSMGTMVGMALGDSFGHPLEFTPATDVPGSDVKTWAVDR
jgi:hypothetical protein